MLIANFTNHFPVGAISVFLNTEVPSQLCKEDVPVGGWKERELQVHLFYYIHSIQIVPAQRRCSINFVKGINDQITHKSLKSIWIFFWENSLETHSLEMLILFDLIYGILNKYI